MWLIQIQDGGQQKIVEPIYQVTWPIQIQDGCQEKNPIKKLFSKSRGQYKIQDSCPRLKIEKNPFLHGHVANINSKMVANKKQLSPDASG